MELDGVADEVGEQLLQLAGVALHDGERVARDGRPGLVDRVLEVGERGVERGVERHPGEGAPLRPHAREREEVLDQPLHPAGAVGGEGDELLRVLVEAVAVAPLEELDVAGDRPERLLEVVRRHIGKALQLLVGTAQVELGLLAVADVDDGGEDERHAVGGHGPAGHHEGDLRAVAPDAAHLGGLTRAAVGCGGRGPVGQEAGNRLPHEDAAGLAEEALDLGVDEGDPAARVDHQEAARRRLDHLAEAGLGLAEGAVEGLGDLAPGAPADEANDDEQQGRQPHHPAQEGAGPLEDGVTRDLHLQDPGHGAEPQRAGEAPAAVGALVHQQRGVARDDGGRGDRAGEVRPEARRAAAHEDADARPEQAGELVARRGAGPYGLPLDDVAEEPLAVEHRRHEGIPDRVGLQVEGRTRQRALDRDELPELVGRLRIEGVARGAGREDPGAIGRPEFNGIADGVVGDELVECRLGGGARGRARGGQELDDVALVGDASKHRQAGARGLVEQLADLAGDLLQAEVGHPDRRRPHLAVGEGGDAGDAEREDRDDEEAEALVGGEAAPGASGSRGLWSGGGHAWPRSVPCSRSPMIRCADVGGRRATGRRFSGTRASRGQTARRVDRPASDRPVLRVTIPSPVRREPRPRPPPTAPPSGGRGPSATADDAT